jgi:NAD(P)-dependent dehydrogenase (short-subunit alcohol dehydrogenase family)
MSILDRFRLDGKKAVVTGGGRGLGRSFARTLAEAGADVAIAEIDPATAEDAAAEIRSIGRQSLAIPTDVSKPEQSVRMVEAVVKAWGRLDIAVNNAAVFLLKDAIDVTEADWDRMMSVNLRGLFFGCQAEARAMMPRRRGKIINIASICGYIVWPTFQSLYSISKAGVIHLTRSVAAEWIKHGINVNSISPGVTRVTDLYPEVIPAFLQHAPIDHIGEVKDHQGALLYLASEVSDFMVGHDLVIDGGYVTM